MDISRAQYEVEKARIQRAADMKKRYPSYTWKQAEELAENVYGLQMQYQLGKSD
jgi:hypothetical protein